MKDLDSKIGAVDAEESVIDYESLDESGIRNVAVTTHNQAMDFGYVDMGVEKMDGKTVLAIGDLEGDLVALIRILRKSGFVKAEKSNNGEGSAIFATDIAKDPNSIVIQTGDIFDRGSKTIGLLRVINDLRSLGINIELVAGNHEVNALQALSVESVKDKDPEFERILKEMITHFRGYEEGDFGDNFLKAFVEVSKNEIKARNREIDDSVLKRKLDDVRKFAFWFLNHGDTVLLELREEMKKEQGVQENPPFLDVVKHGYDMFNGGEFDNLKYGLKAMKQESNTLYVHGGIDDNVASYIEQYGIDGLNQLFAEAVHSNNYEHFVYGGYLAAVTAKRGCEISPYAASVLNDLGIDVILRGHDKQSSGEQGVVESNGIVTINNDIGTRNSGGVLVRPNGMFECFNEKRQESKILYFPKGKGGMERRAANDNARWVA